MGFGGRHSVLEHAKQVPPDLQPFSFLSMLPCPSMSAAMHCTPMSVAIYCTPMSAAMGRKYAKSVMGKLGKAVGTIMARIAGTHELGEAMEMRMRALGVQLEETRRELAAAKGEFVAVKDETEVGLRALGVQLEETRRELEEADERRAADLRGLREPVEETRRQVTAVKGELAEHKGLITGQAEEVTAMKGELAEHKDSMQGHAEDLGLVKEELAAGKMVLAAHNNSLKGEVVEQTNHMLNVEVAFEEALVSLVRGDRGSTRALEVSAECGLWFLFVL
ncbi:unnamed protein product [Closterium sp. NIES-64]|nr:unnamed protein product [Closterium sp. NIES-64]